MSSRKVNGDAASRATTPQLEQAEPAWQAILEAMKQPSISLYRVYQRAGITKSRRYWLRKAPDLRVSVAYRMALAARIDPGKFMTALAVAQNPQALNPDPDRIDRSKPDFLPRKRRPRCSVCGKQGHNRRRCTSSISSEELLLLGRGVAMATRELSKKGK